MPYREYEDDEFEQQWDPIIIKKDPSKGSSTVIANKILDFDSREKIKNKRESLKLSQLSLNTKCKFPYKYTIRDIETGKSSLNLSELKTINTVLDLDIKF
jgi:ribosome-binding protein aMBF1 (putative translation factor)